MMTTNKTDETRGETKPRRYNITNRVEDYKKYFTDYYHEHKDKMKEKATRRVKCALCGCEINYASYNNHKKSKKCLKARPQETETNNLP
jgi:hypothetical protein